MSASRVKGFLGFCSSIDSLYARVPVYIYTVLADWGSVTERLAFKL